MNPDSSQNNSGNERSNAGSWAHNFRPDNDSIFSALFCGTIPSVSTNDRYFPSSPERVESSHASMRKMNTDSAPVRSSPTFDPRNVSDDRINPDGNIPKTTSSARGASAVRYETTADGDVAFVESSFDADDPAASSEVTPMKDDSPAIFSKNIPGSVLPHNAAPPSKKRGHSRNLSEHFNEATNLKFSAIQEAQPGQQLPYPSHQDRFYGGPAAYSAYGASPYGTQVPAPAAGQKHRRGFSGDITNPPNAHRRINSIGNAAVIKRRSFERSRQHHRVDSAGLDVLTAAVESSQEEIEAAAGRRPGYAGRHSWDGPPPVHRTFPRPPDDRRLSDGPQYPIPSDYGRGPTSIHPRSGQAHPLSHHSQIHQYQQHVSYAPPAAHFRPPSSAGRPAPYGHTTPYSAPSSYFPPPPPHHPGAYPTHHDHHRAAPSSDMGYSVQHPRYPPPPFAQRPIEKKPLPPPSLSDPSSAGTTARQPSPNSQQGDDRIAADERAALKSTQWNESVPQSNADAQSLRKKTPDKPGHHRKLSSFSNNLGNIFSPGDIPTAESSRPKGAHHRATSSISVFPGIGAPNLGGSDFSFLQHLQASSGEPSGSFAGPHIAADEDTKPSPTQSSRTATSPTDSASLGSDTKLASGGSSKRVRRKCTVAGCANRVVQGGLCISHGAKRKTCKHPGCQKNVKKAGLCSAHGPARKRCEAHGCSKVAVQGGRCIAHGAKKKLCSVEDCPKQAILAGMCKKHHDQNNPDGNEDNDLQCQPIDDGPPAVGHKPTHTRGLSIFQELNPGEIGTLLQNPDPSGAEAQPSEPQGAAARTRRQRSRDFGVYQS